jgi:quercetin dioxygenase-like cupin family protein
MAQPLFGFDAVSEANLLELIICVKSGTVRKTLMDAPGLKQVLFAMDAGQELSEHRSPYLALVHVLDGTMRMRVNGQDHALRPASWLLMPPDTPHDVHADEPTRFLLTLMRTSSSASR